jgi:hypothetical protein
MNNLRIVRYARPKQKEIHNDNLYGITFVYDIDYEDRIVWASWSICNGDNFEKKVGVEQALKRKKLTFPLDDVKNTGLTKAFMNRLFGKDVGGMVVGNYTLMHHVLSEVTRYINSEKTI